MKRKVLILCTGNSCRSIMAEALINHFLSDSWESYSAGVSPSVVNPKALMVLEELSIHTSKFYSKSVTDFQHRTDLDLVVTVCDHANEHCPIFPGSVKKLHLSFTDPAPYSNEPDEMALPIFRAVRDDIRARLLPMLEAI